MAAPSLGEWTNLFIAATAAAQVFLGWALWKVSRALHRLQQDQFTSQGPLFKVYFNGFQSHPKDPKNEPLAFRLTIANEGRTNARMDHCGIVVLESDGKDAGLQEVLTLFPVEHVKWRTNARGEYGPEYGSPNDSGRDSRNDLFIPNNDARSYIAFLPANGGYERWKRVRLYAIPIGGPEASVEPRWHLFWLEHH